MARAWFFALICVHLALNAACYAQSTMAEGTYGLASVAQFQNSSSFGSATAIVVTQGVYEVSNSGFQNLASLRLEDGRGNVVFMTVTFNVGYSSSSNLANMVITECVENNIQGNGFGFSVCTAANAENGCSRSIDWGQATVDTPFTGRTLIVMANFCGLQGTQLWQCGSLGGCDVVPSNSSVPALPVGNFVLTGSPPQFLYESPQVNPVSLTASTITDFNNHEYMLVFTFESEPVTIIARIYGAVVVDQNSELLFSFYNCSQSVSGGPAPVDICVITTSGGCEIATADSQFDLNPPNNETVVQLPQWCDFFGNLQYQCSGTCEGPINRQVTPAELGFTAGNCLEFNGDQLDVTGECTLPDLTIINLNVTNSTVQQQTVIQQTVVEQTVIQQNVTQQNVTNQFITQQEVTYQTIVNQTVIYQQSDDVIAERLYVGGRISQFYLYSNVNTFMQFLDSNALPCGSEYNPGSGNPYPIPVTILLERIGSLVHGLMQFNNDAAGITSPGGCTYFGTGPSQIPNFARPSQTVQGRVSPFMVSTDGSNICTINFRMTVGSNGAMLFLPYRNSGSTCGMGSSNGPVMYGFNNDPAGEAYFIGSFLSPTVTPPTGVNSFDFAYTINNYS